DLDIGTLRARRAAEAGWRGPVQLGRARARGTQALLADVDRRRLGAVERDVEQGHAGLLDEGAEHGDRFRPAPGRLTQRAHEILRRRGAVGMALEESAHAFAEALGPEPGLEGREHCGALVV